MGKQFMEEDSKDRSSGKRTERARVRIDKGSHLAGGYSINCAPILTRPLCVPCLRIQTPVISHHTHKSHETPT
jgi:hypothetical protein